MEDARRAGRATVATVARNVGHDLPQEDPTAFAAAVWELASIRDPSPLVAIDHEAPAMLIVGPPLPEPLALERVIIQYRTEHLRVVPVCGGGALDASPRIDHVHITANDAPRNFVEASGETVVLLGLEPGPHTVLFELADPTRRVITSAAVKFTVPEPEAPASRQQRPSVGTSRPDVGSPGDTSRSRGNRLRATASNRREEG